MNKNLNEILGNLAHVGVIPDEAVSAITQLVTKEIDSWRNGIAEELKSKIKNWEELEMDNPDSALYSLGLRQAVDLILEEKPLEEPPILETDEVIEIPITDMDEGEDG